MSKRGKINLISNTPSSQVREVVIIAPGSHLRNLTLTKWCHWPRPVLTYSMASCQPVHQDGMQCQGPPLSTSLTLGKSLSLSCSNLQPRNSGWSKGEAGGRCCLQTYFVWPAHCCNWIWMPLGKQELNSFKVVYATQPFIFNSQNTIQVLLLTCLEFVSFWPMNSWTTCLCTLITLSSTDSLVPSLLHTHFLMYPGVC